MDGSRFDDWARTLAVSASRRRLLGRLVGGAIGGLAAGLLGASDAAARCRSDTRACSKHAQCCSGFCNGIGRKVRRACADCDSGIVCGNICCPPDALKGCTSINLPDGPILGCLCPEGTLYDREANECRPCGPTAPCRSDDNCCESRCCGGACCSNDRACCDGVCWGTAQVCCDGVCSDPLDCNCPRGSSCLGTATCISFGQSIYSSAALCCSWPYIGFCCHETAPGAGDGVAGCCNVVGPEGSCSDDAICSTPINHPGYHYCVPVNDDCCDLPSLEDRNFEESCVWEGAPCHPDWPCCKGPCVDGVCSCVGEGDECGPSTFCCTGLHCSPPDNPTCEYV